MLNVGFHPEVRWHPMILRPFDLVDDDRKKSMWKILPRMVVGMILRNRMMKYEYWWVLLVVLVLVLVVVVMEEPKLDVPRHVEVFVMFSFVP